MSDFSRGVKHSTVRPLIGSPKRWDKENLLNFCRKCILVLAIGMMGCAFRWIVNVIAQQLVSHFNSGVQYFCMSSDSPVSVFFAGYGLIVSFLIAIGFEDRKKHRRTYVLFSHIALWLSYATAAFVGICLPELFQSENISIFIFMILFSMCFLSAIITHLEIEILNEKIAESSAELRNIQFHKYRSLQRSHSKFADKVSEAKIWRWIVVGLALWFSFALVISVLEALVPFLCQLLKCGLTDLDWSLGKSLSVAIIGVFAAVELLPFVRWFLDVDYARWFNGELKSFRHSGERVKNSFLSLLLFMYCFSIASQCISALYLCFGHTLNADNIICKILLDSAVLAVVWTVVTYRTMFKFLWKDKAADLEASVIFVQRSVERQNFELYTHFLLQKESVYLDVFRGMVYSSVLELTDFSDDLLWAKNCYSTEDRDGVVAVPLLALSASELRKLNDGFDSNCVTDEPSCNCLKILRFLHVSHSEEALFRQAIDYYLKAILYNLDYVSRDR